MARQPNDGRGRLGGRQKGTPNKSTAELRDFVLKLVTSNMAQIKKDIKALDPAERVRFWDRLMQYCLPRQQAVMSDVALAIDRDELEQFHIWQRREAKLKAMTDEELQAELERINKSIANI